MCDNAFKTYDLNHATQALHQFITADFCDIYLEYSKAVLKSGEPEKQDVVRSILHLSLDTILRALSPFMPFLTEELYQRLHIDNPDSAESVCVASYPDIADDTLRNEAIESAMDLVSRIVGSVLVCRRNFSLTKARQDVYIQTNPDVAKTLQDFQTTLTTLSRASSVSFLTCGQDIPAGCVKCKEDEDVMVLVKLQVRTL